MKKTLMIFGVLVLLAFALAACGRNDNDNGNDNGNGDTQVVTEDVDFYDLLVQLYANEDAGYPMTFDIELTEENFTRFLFIDYIPGSQGIVSEAAIMTQPHSVVILQVPPGYNAHDVAAQIEDAADPAKWICVAADAVKVVVHNDIIIFIMSRNEWMVNILDDIPTSFTAIRSR